MPNLVVGSLLEAKADAIVNPANGFLMHGAGLARLIANAAAPSVPFDDPRFAIGKAWKAEQNQPTVATGDAVTTSAGCLPFKGIIHVVGPVWKDGMFYEDYLLQSCINSIAREALEHGWTEVAVPAISCGLFRYPVEKAAQLMWAEASRAEDYCPGYHLTFYVTPEHAEAFQAASA